MRRTDLHQMALDAWGSGTVTLVLLLGLEIAARGFVSRFFNMLWLLLAVLAASVAVLATHPGTEGKEHPHAPPREAHVLLQLAAVASAAAAWVFLPKELATHWRALASGTLLIAALVAVPSLMKKE